MTHHYRPALRRALAHARPRGSQTIRSGDVASVITEALTAAGLMDRTTSPKHEAEPTAGPTGPAGLRLPRGGKTVGRGAGMRVPSGYRTAPPDLPPGSTWEAHRHSGPEGSRDFRLFLPSPRTDGPSGVLVMLHGCTQDPEDFARGTRMCDVAEECGLAVVWPQQGPGHNPQSCWNWFRPEDQRREGGEPAIIAAITHRVLADLDLPEGRAAVAGLSAGGAMAAILAVTHPDLFAAAGVHSGLPAGSARDVASAFAAMRSGKGRQRAGAPLIVFHGTGDATVAPTNADALVPEPGVETAHGHDGRRWTRRVTANGSELWRVDGAGHAWFGGDAGGSYADPLGPDASREIARFALENMRGSVDA